MSDTPAGGISPGILWPSDAEKYKAALERITTLEQRIADLEPQLAAQQWTYCPECGSEEIHYQEGPHKQCKACKQEWFSDVDYTTAVKANLARRMELEAAQQWVPVSDVDPVMKCDWLHSKSGVIYTVIGVANHYSERPNYPKTVVYKGPDNRVWCKPLTEFYRTMEPTPTTQT